MKKLKNSLCLCAFVWDFLLHLCLPLNTPIMKRKDMKLWFSNDTQFKFRAIAVAFAVFLVICSLVMGITLITTLFGIGAFPSKIGNFFAKSFGILSFLIPAYLCYAAFILADPRWRPERIFNLNAGLFPFLTLALGLAFIRDFELRAAQYAFLDFAGKTGFSFVIVFIAIIEVLSLQTLKNALFRERQNSGSSEVRDNYANHAKNIILLPHIKQEQETDNVKPDDQVKNEEAAPLATEERQPESEAEELETILETIDEEPEIIEETDPVKEPEIDNEGVTQALEEAAAAAASIHEEQVRKKTAQYNGFQSKKYRVPVEILKEYPDGEYWIIDQATKDAALALKDTLEEFKIQAEVTGIRKGPVITMFEILPAPGVKLSRIVGLQDNIALRLAASSVRIVAPIPGKHAVGIEVPNAQRNTVSFREIISGELLQTGKRMEIPVVMGKDIAGEAQTVDLVQMPHILIAGATGSGKSVCVNSMILSILYMLHPADCRLILIDPKIVELKLYNDIPHLLTPVITEPKKAFQALQYCIFEMERRYACLDSMGVRDIRSYNKRIREKNIAQERLPYIVVVIDEFADLMTTTGKELESTVARLAAMSRAVGIHLVLATQRPSIDVITGLIKANIPSRIAFMVASKTDSRIIIDMVGAEKLLGKGDMLYAGAVDPFPVRMQGAFVSEEEVEAVVAHIKTFGAPEYIDDEIFFEDEEDNNSPSFFTDGDDPLYDKALEIVMQQGKASASYIQRRLKIGFNRAARLVDEMEHRGVVGPAQGSKPREVLKGA
jgi:S-DNA-T family DNA segregation ATPase FtsK/SpoIIIE